MNPHAEYTKLTKHQKRQINKPMRRRSPEEWVEMVEELPVAVQPVIARIVWWDYFGARISGDAWHHLDEIREKPLGKVEERVQIEALIKLGFSARGATQRVGFKESR